MQHREEGPPTVAAPIGREGAKLLQRFNELGSAQRKELLGDALAMIERQREERLSPRDRQAARLIDLVTHTIEASGNQSEAEHHPIWRACLAERVDRLAAMGITYFGGIAHA